VCRDVVLLLGGWGGGGGGGGGSVGFLCFDLLGHLSNSGEHYT